MAKDLNVDQIKKLWILDLIIQTGSFKSAALQAKVTPSAISQTITSLERSLGKSLLVRDGSAIRPTPEALNILKIIQPAFVAFDQLKEMNNRPVPEVSWINFGTYESIAVDILPGLIGTLRDKLPKARLGLRVARTQQLLTMVRKGDLCSALITQVDDLQRFYKKVVYLDRLGLFVSKKHEIANLGFEAISKYGLGSLAAGKEGLPRYFLKYMKQLNISKPLVSCESFETLRAACAAGCIVSVLPLRVARRSHDLIELNLPKSMKEIGEHELIVVSQTSCDREETDFISNEIQNILNANR